jgi:hypothetical protein
MRIRFSNSKRLALLGFAACLTAFATGSSLQTFAHLGTSNDLLWPNTNSFSGFFDPLGGYVEASGEEQFTGPDRNGDERTTTFGGFASADASYGRLRTSLTASLTNSFYNAGNAENGIPNIYVGAGQARFEDTLHFSGTLLVPSFKVRYTYFIHGQVTGKAYGALSMDIGANHESLFIDSNDGPLIGQYYTTDLYELNPNLYHDISTNFLAGFQQDTKFIPDGFNVSGSADFSSTVTMTNIEMFDQNGHQFYDFSVLSDSGFNYPAANAVPEPATLLVTGLGVLACLRRRSQNRR